MNKKIKAVLVAMSLSAILCGCGSGLTGTYTSEKGESYTFKSDGTFINSMESGMSTKGTYEKNDDGSYTIFIDAGILSTSGTFTIEDDVMTAKFGKKEYQYYKE